MARSDLLEQMAVAELKRFCTVCYPGDATLGLTARQAAFIAGRRGRRAEIALHHLALCHQLRQRLIQPFRRERVARQDLRACHRAGVAEEAAEDGE